MVKAHLCLGRARVLVGLGLLWWGCRGGGGLAWLAGDWLPARPPTVMGDPTTTHHTLHCCAQSVHHPPPTSLLPLTPAHRSSCNSVLLPAPDALHHLTALSAYHCWYCGFSFGLIHQHHPATTPHQRLSRRPPLLRHAALPLLHQSRLLLSAISFPHSHFVIWRITVSTFPVPGILFESNPSTYPRFALKSRLFPKCCE